MLNGVYLSENPSEFSVVGIAIDKPEKVAQFVAELGIDFPIMIGQSNAYEKISNIRYLFIKKKYVWIIQFNALAICLIDKVRR